jgi:hypothetical protein
VGIFTGGPNFTSLELLGLKVNEFVSGEALRFIFSSGVFKILATGSARDAGVTGKF